ncbi:alpha/beta fold hydrolase [Corynebacterium sp. H78]|uniref:alpha/beta fold hydrolase n=1 Tax=Corynebacterium sp. H78 TaxID=3133417 RepID=UPI00309CF85A
MTTQHGTESTTDPANTAGTVDNPLDLLIVGAGLSGINMAHHVAENFPSWSWEMHDVHDDIGGTWHTFRYPGIRSDSDMATFAFPFRPWPHKGTLGGGPEIKEYLRDVARDCGALDRLHTGSWIKNADWQTDKNLYAITAVTSDGERTIYARRVHYGSGYYAHDRGYRPTFPGEEDFTGEIIHPQQWPEDLDVAGKKIVVIGSGATAVTLIPALDDGGAHATMLQRSPSYVAPLPAVDLISGFWKTVLPDDLGSRVARANHIARDMAQWEMAKRTPKLLKFGIRMMQRPFLPAREIDKHFTPTYNPWDQRVCKAPNGDIFTALKRNASVVTDTIDRFTPDGILLMSGQELKADIIVSATGLELEAFGGGTLSIDGNELKLDEQVFYRGIMLAGLPNFSFTIGYVNASWTLRSDMVARYMIKLWKTGEQYYCPALPTGRTDIPMMELDAGYIHRGIRRFPTQGDSSPWQYTQNYISEVPEITYGDQRREMLFGQDCLDMASSSTPGPRRLGPAVTTITSDEPFTETDLTDLPETENITVNGRTVRVRRGGPSGRPSDVGHTDADNTAGNHVDDIPIVMIHGIGRSLEDWDDQAIFVGKHKRFIAIDIPGFGFSDPAAEITLAGTAELLWATLDELGEKRIHLVGNSLGGALSMEMTAQRPDAVVSVALIDPAGFGDSTTPLLRLVAAPRVGQLSAAATKLKLMYAPIEHVILRRPGSATSRRVAVQGAIARHPHRSRTFYSFVRVLGGLKGIRPEWREDLVARFNEVAGRDSSQDTDVEARRPQIPVMLTWGNKDAILPYRDFRACLEQIDVDHAVVFDGCGHMPQLEFPQEFADSLLGFLRHDDPAAQHTATDEKEPAH